MSPKPGYWILMLAALFVGVIIGVFLGTSTTRRELQAQAIKGGHAAWRVTDEHGSVTFEWQASHAGEPIPKPAEKVK